MSDYLRIHLKGERKERPVSDSGSYQKPLGFWRNIVTGGRKDTR